VIAVRRIVNDLDRRLLNGFRDHGRPLFDVEPFAVVHLYLRSRPVLAHAEDAVGIQPDLSFRAGL